MEEATATQMEKSAGMPVPKVLCCEEHPNDTDNRFFFFFFSILMTRLPGEPLENSRYPMEVDFEGLVAAGARLVCTQCVHGVHLTKILFVHQSGHLYHAHGFLAMSWPFRK